MWGFFRRRWDAYINPWSPLLYWVSVVLLLLFTWLHFVTGMGLALVGILISRIWRARPRDRLSLRDRLLVGDWFRWPRNLRELGIVVLGWTLLGLLVVLLWKEILTLALLLLVAAVLLRLFWQRLRGRAGRGRPPADNQRPAPTRGGMPVNTDGALAKRERRQSKRGPKRPQFLTWFPRPAAGHHHSGREAKARSAQRRASR